MDIQQLKQNSTATAGCRLYLTKALGVGVLSTAQKRGVLRPEDAAIALKSMVTLNKPGAAFGKLDGVKAMTDVTGFGLLGHLAEMCEGSGLSAVIEFSKVPVIPSLPYYLDQNCYPGGTQRNWNSYGHKVGNLTDHQRFILADPQTSGGLLVAVEPEGVEAFEELLKEQGLNENHLIPFGWLEERTDGPVISVV
ncbi:Selenide, water dikinase [compost metagenome]